jgi:hypothetical protein
MMKRMNRKKVSLAVRQAISAGVVFGLAAPLVHAQQAATPPVQTLEKVEVTGSRITSATFESASPINTITAQDIAITGLQSTANIINQLPQAFADQGGSISNGASGTSTVNLRNLGPNRTLVLIDGKRVPAGSPTTYATNLNNIPAPLIKRIEVLTGGASAVYGSDAVAGVVNFIMNDSFEGVQIQYNGSTYQHTQNGSYGDLAARAATNPAQFQVPGDFLGRRHRPELQHPDGIELCQRQGQRDDLLPVPEHQRAAPEQVQLQRLLVRKHRRSGRLAAAVRRLVDGVPGRFTNGNTGKSATIVNAAGRRAAVLHGAGPVQLRSVQLLSASARGLPGQRVRALRPVRRRRQEVDAQRPRLCRIRFHQHHLGRANRAGRHFLRRVRPAARREPAAVGLLQELLRHHAGQSSRYAADRPSQHRRRWSRAAVRFQRLALRPRCEGRFRQSHVDYDFWWQSGKNSLNQVTANYFASDRIQKALNVVKDPATGRPVCASFLDGTDINCVPYDIYHNGGVTQAALDYLQVPGIQNGFTQQNVVGLHLTSDLGAAYGWTLPWAKNGVGVAFGIEHRTDRLQNVPDSQTVHRQLLAAAAAQPFRSKAR